MSEKITVAHLLVTLDRIEEWMQVLRTGLEALPQEQEIEISASSLKNSPGTRAIWLKKDC